MIMFSIAGRIQTKDQSSGDMEKSWSLGKIVVR
jgi:hypothetical protein